MTKVILIVCCIVEGNGNLAGMTGIEPVTGRLTADCSTY